MIALALMLAAQIGGAPDLMRRAGERLAVADAEVGVADPDAGFRVEGEAAPTEVRQRAVDAKGTSCGTSARVCTRPPRTWVRVPTGR